jgi:RHS repeat-associated protein
LGRAYKTSNPYRPNETIYWTTSEFDALGRVIKVETPDGAQAKTAYDGNRTLVTDQAGKQRISKTNAVGQLKDIWEITSADSSSVSVSFPSQTLSAGYQTSYQYDTLNNLTTVSQGIQTRTFQYDSLSRLKQAQNPESGTINYSYDANGNLLSKIDARQITTNFAYDNLNRVISRSYADGVTPQVNYTYDDALIANSKGQLTKVSSIVSQTEYTAFDVMGKILSHRQTTDGTAYTTGYSYNLSGALIEQTYPSGRAVKNVLDNDGDLSQLKSKKNTNSGFVNYAKNFTYTAAGAVSSMQLGNGAWESTVFNPRLQPTQIGLGTVKNGIDKLKLNYTYTSNGENNNNGNVLSQQITVPTDQYQGFTATQNYTYDSLNRLKSAEETIPTLTGWKQTFSYDRYGNRNFDVNNTTTLGSCSQNVCNPTVDVSNNRFTTSQGYTYDLAGNVVNDAHGRQFAYDAENKQKSVTSSGITIGQYFYDGDGKRLKKVNPQTGETTVFVYDASGKMVAEYSTTAPTTARVSYLTSDHLGSPRINTDANGNVFARHDYLPFGEEITSTTTPVRSINLNYGDDGIKQKFTSYERDNESSLDYAKARYHNYNHGRFTSVDPIMMTKKRLADPQAINLYVYVRNNPLRFTDPDGKEFVDENGNKIKVKKKDGQIIVTGHKKTPKDSKALADLQKMAGLVNGAGSKTATSQFMKLSKNDTKIHFKIETERAGRPSLNGVHEAHNESGTRLSWDSRTGKFNEKPAYNKDGTYKEATITIFEGSIEKNLDDTRQAFGDPNITKNEAMVSVFGHEAEHNLNKRDIAEIKGRYEGKGTNYNVDEFDPINQRFSAAYQISIAVFAEIP